MDDNLQLNSIRRDRRETELTSKNQKAKAIAILSLVFHDNSFNCRVRQGFEIRFA